LEKYMSEKDNLYEQRATQPGSFRFDEQVAAVFPDMISRSVPGYSVIVPMIGQLARRFVQSNSVVHDLGCSLGASTLAVRQALLGRESVQGVRIVATDNAPAMVARCEALLSEGCVGGRVPAIPVDVVCGDIREADFQRASMVIMNFTLQFLDLDARDALIQRIGAEMLPGGALVLAEKIRFPDAQEQTRQTHWHEDYKRLQGYSELEIARKRTALEQVLVAETEGAHLARLRGAGFSRVTRWFQCFGFCAYLAEK
jgi:tRNA (cmo5U34)-methyltransferase